MKLTPRARLLIPALVAGLTLPLTTATPASAQSAFATRIGGQVAVSGLPGEANTIVLFGLGPLNAIDLAIADTNEGVVAGPGCTQFSPAVARCGRWSTVSRITVRLGDQDDTYFHDIGAVFPATVDPGAGSDDIFAGPRGDTISARDGAVDEIDCGGGFDVVTADPADVVAANCELVRRA
ncbi:hypothetical protein ACFW6V_04765 [Streptomyces sp. NPDC058734]|uniref:hypothetical protein n=1 Tax=Streptomyces sp. NPDC058734 TaxID=3346615 RepID=UPI0036B97A04